MGEKTAKWVFWAGTLSSLVLFLALTIDTNGQFAALTNADKLDGQVVAGKRAFERHNCNDCHTILGFGGYYAPDLTRAYRRVGEDAIKRRLEHPEIAWQRSYRKMPQQHLTQQEVGGHHRLPALGRRDRQPRLAPAGLDARWKRSTDRCWRAPRCRPRRRWSSRRTACPATPSETAARAKDRGWSGSAPARRRLHRAVPG